MQLLFAALARLHQGPTDPTTAPEGGADSLWSKIYGWAEWLWTLKLFGNGDNEIYVSNVVVGLAIFLLGLLVARRLARVVRGAFLPRVRVSPGGAAAIESILFYLLLMVVGYSALGMANIPLTAFTLLGGAAAIGVGFGSQTLVSNFIAGLILLFEQPIREGDLIQVDELYGNVMRVGARSTRVRTGDNVEIVVPNSIFLEQRIVNWTLSETRVRISVTVGVAYGSPTREVERLIQQALAEHDKVHADPAPVVLFKDFGDNSLAFVAHFWIDMTTMMQRNITESDVRYRIDELFREADITIAFPQRDVHVDTIKPLDVRLVRAQHLTDDEE